MPSGSSPAFVPGGFAGFPARRAGAAGAGTRQPRSPRALSAGPAAADPASRRPSRERLTGPGLTLAACTLSEPGLPGVWGPFSQVMPRGPRSPDPPLLRPPSPDSPDSDLRRAQGRMKCCQTSSLSTSCSPKTQKPSTPPPPVEGSLHVSQTKVTPPHTHNSFVCQPGCSLARLRVRACECVLRGTRSPLKFFVTVPFQILLGLF